MRIKTGLAIPMMAGMSARLDQAERMAEQKVTVYKQNDLGVPSAKAGSTLAAGMFAGAGIKVASVPASRLSTTEVCDSLDSGFSR